MLGAAPAAHAGQYVVRSCDAAPPSWDSSAWTPQSGSVNSYKLCPSPTGSTPNGRGMATRAVGRTFSAGEYSRLWFFAPSGTTITRLDWAGRMARNTPSWQVEIRAQGGVSDSRLLGWVAQPGHTGWYETGREQPHVGTYTPPVGTTRLMQNTQCGGGQCGSGATMHTYFAAVTLNDHSPPSVSMSGVTQGEWVRADRTIGFSAHDNIGIKSVHLYIDGQLRDSAHFACNYTQRVPCANRSGAFPLHSRELGDGAHRVEVRAYDGSDTPVSTARTIHVDNTPPAQVAPVVDGGEGWRNRNGFSVRWQPVSDGGAPIVGGTWQLCRPVAGHCSSHPIDTAGPSSLPPFHVAADGVHELRVVLRDQAGNVASLTDARPAILRLDRDAPSVAVDRFDPNAPLRAAATVADGLSGIAGGQLELRRVGAATWREVPTAVQSGKLVATIDDERLDDGDSELRARVRDRAGNETSTATEANGARALRQLPVRFKTRLRAGRIAVRKVKRRVRRDGRRRLVTRRVRRLVPRVTVRYKRHATIRGVLANTDGQPLHDVPVEVSARPDLPGASFTAAGLVRTDRDGRFAYKVHGKHSRTLRFRYLGSSRIRPSTTDVRVRVPASTSFRLTPRRILNGETVTFRGRVRGGPIPDQGKLIELRKWTGRKWAPFRVVRTDSAGRWKHTEQVISVSGIVTYRLRAHLPAEAGFPYNAGRTPARKLRVRGR
jgi:hypothetical protein